MVLYEHQCDADDRRAVLDAHHLRAHVSPTLLLKQVRPEDHGQVSGRHLVSGDLESRGRGGGDGGQSADGICCGKLSLRNGILLDFFLHS